MRAAWALIVLAVASCADGSGVLIEIRRPVDDPATPVNETREVLPDNDDADLRLFAGVASGIDQMTNGRAGWYLDDSTEDDDPEVPGNGLLWKDPSQPFRALLTPVSATEGDAIHAIAHASSAMDATGGLATPVPVGDGLTRARLQLALAGPAPPTVNDPVGRCVADPANQIFFDPNVLDCDGDSWNYPYDCDDMDRDNYPLYGDVACCNRDNTTPIVSVRTIGGSGGCELILSCDGNDPLATGGTWTTTDLSFCNCAADLADCGATADFHCDVRHDLDGEPCPGLSTLAAPSTSCSWRMVGRGGPYQLEFATGDLTSASCNPEVAVSLSSDAPADYSWAAVDLNGEIMLVVIDPALDVGCTIPPALSCRPL